MTVNVTRARKTLHRRMGHTELLGWKDVGFIDLSGYEGGPGDECPGATTDHVHHADGWHVGEPYDGCPVLTTPCPKP